MDLFILQSMVFVLLLVLVLGGIVLAFPVTRRLGDALDEWIRLRRQGRLGSDQAGRLEDELREVRERLETLERETDLLADRQAFTESLLARPDEGEDAPAEDGDAGP